MTSGAARLYVSWWSNNAFLTINYVGTNMRESMWTDKPWVGVRHVRKTLPHKESFIEFFSIQQNHTRVINNNPLRYWHNCSNATWVNMQFPPVKREHVMFGFPTLSHNVSNNEIWHIYTFNHFVIYFHTGTITSGNQQSVTGNILHLHMFVIKLCTCENWVKGSQ